MNWHPFAEKFPLLVGDEKKALAESIKATGGNQQQPIHYRVKDGKRQGLDGRNRWLVCKELGITPTLEEVEVGDDEVYEFIKRKNIYRRHMNRELRKLLTDDMDDNGFSKRKIASVLGVSPNTVRSDLRSKRDSGGSNCTPDSMPSDDDPPADPPPKTTTKKVTGRDGKSYPAKPKRKPVPQVRTDALGKPVPDHLRDVFFDSWLTDAADRIQSFGSQHISAVRRAVVGKSGPYGAWLESKRLLDAIDEIAALASEVERLLTKDKPHAVCSCSGEGCKQCRQSGWIPKWRYSEIKTGVCSE